MAQSNVAHVIEKILNKSNMTLSDLQKNLMDTSNYEFLTKEELKALKHIDIKQVENFLKDADARRLNSLCNINHA